MTLLGRIIQGAGGTIGPPVTAPGSGGTNLRIFKWSYELTLISQPTPTSAGSASYFDTSQVGSPNALVITDLRIQFDIKKNVGSQPNTCLVTVTNLSKESRGRLDRKPVYAILRAGHDGVLKPLFEGNVTFAISNLKSPDWETKIQIADGGRAYSQARMNRSYAPPINAKRVLSDAAASMGLSLPADLSAAVELQAAFAGGYSAHGPVRDVLTTVLAPYGYSWSIQNGRLQVIKAGLPNANTAWVIEVDTGMISSPEGSVPHKPGQSSEVSVDVSLFPEIGAADAIQINSKSYNGGLFRVNDVNHKGDNFGDHWATSLRSTPLDSPPPTGRGKR